MDTSIVKNEVATALEENLLLVYPQGPPADDTVIQQWLQEIIVHQQEHNEEPSADVLEHALQQAVTAWKQKAVATTLEVSNKTAKTSESSTSKSFSLFSQLDAWGAPRIAIDDLLAEDLADEARLQLLQKVAHVDDVAMDWKEVKLLLETGLQSSSLLLANDYRNLHRKWFDQGRTSAEHLEIRCDLCQNVLTAIGTCVVRHWKTEGNYCLTANGTFSPIQENVHALWKLWYDMWFDLLQQPIGNHEDKLGRVGHQVLLLGRSLLDLESTALPPPIQGLALVDPNATWFQCWSSRLTPAQLIHVLVSTKILPDIWNRAKGNVNMLWDTTLCQSHAQLMEVVSGLHAASMLTCILVCTRLEYFPASCIWNQNELLPTTSWSLADLTEQLANILFDEVADSSNTEILATHASSISHSHTEQMFQLFLDIGSAAVPKPKECLFSRLVVICCEAIEVILNGTYSRNYLQELHTSLIKKCREVTLEQENGLFATQLRKVSCSHGLK